MHNPFFHLKHLSDNEMNPNETHVIPSIEVS